MVCLAFLMDENLDFLEKFPRNRSNLNIVYDLYTFDNMFRLLLKSGYSHREALVFMLANCSFSAVVFQERIHNCTYENLVAEDALCAEQAACKAQVIYELME
jgi:hypothetical protein